MYDFKVSLQLMDENGHKLGAEMEGRNGRHKR